MTRRQRRLTVLVTVGVALVLSMGGAGSAMAEGSGALTSASRTTGETAAAPGRSPQKPVASPPKKTAAPLNLERANLERATPSERDRPVLSLLWLLTGSSRRH
jgi:hypothetical protein